MIGGVGDRMRRGLALVLAYVAVTVGAAITLATLVLHMPVWAVLAAGSLFMLTVSGVRPVHFSVLPNLSGGPEELVSANAMSAASDEFAEFLGPVLAGLLFALVGAVVRPRGQDGARPHRGGSVPAPRRRVALVGGRGRGLARRPRGLAACCGAGPLALLIIRADDPTSSSPVRSASSASRSPEASLGRTGLFSTWRWWSARGHRRRGRRRALGGLSPASSTLLVVGSTVISRASRTPSSRVSRRCWRDVPFAVVGAGRANHAGRRTRCCSAPPTTAS